MLPALDTQPQRAAPHFEEPEKREEATGTRAANPRSPSITSIPGVSIILTALTLSVRFVAVHIRSGGLATQEEVAGAFGHSVATQRRWEIRYQEKGLEGLVNGKSSGRPRGVPETCDLLLRKWFSQNVSNTEMARRLGVGHTSIHRALARLGLRRRSPASAELPWQDDVSADSHERRIDETCPSSRVTESKGSDESRTASRAEPSQEEEPLGDAANSSIESQPADLPESAQNSALTALSKDVDGHVRCTIESLEDTLARLALEGFTIDHDPDHRTGDRALARIGLLEDAIPLFKDRPCLARAGVLLSHSAAFTERPLGSVFPGLSQLGGCVLRAANDRRGVIPDRPAANQASGEL